MIVIVVAPAGDDLPHRVALALGVDSDLVLAAAAPGHDHLVVGSSPDGTFCVPCTAESAADLVRQFLASGSLDPVDLMAVPESVKALLQTH